MSMTTKLNGLGRQEMPRAPTCACGRPVCKTRVGRSSAVTNLAALPTRNGTVDISFPGPPTLRNVPITRSSDGSTATRGTTDAAPRTWTYRVTDLPAAGTTPTAQPASDPRQMSRLLQHWPRRADRSGLNDVLPGCGPHDVKSVRADPSQCRSGRAGRPGPTGGGLQQPSRRLVRAPPAVHLGGIGAEQAAEGEEHQAGGRGSLSDQGIHHPLSRPGQGQEDRRSRLRALITP